MSIKITRHEIRKGDAGNITGIVIGVTYTNPVTQRQAYRDVLFSAKDFSIPPTRAEVAAKIKDWLTTISETGGSILQGMKNESQRTQETMVELKQGGSSSLVGETLTGV